MGFPHGKEKPESRLRIEKRFVSVKHGTLLLSAECLNLMIKRHCWLCFDGLPELGLSSAYRKSVQKLALFKLLNAFSKRLERDFMKINIVGKNFTVTKALEEKINKKLKGLEKYFLIGENDTAKVLLTAYPTKQKIEVTIPTKFAILRAETSDTDLYNAIDKVVDKLKDQIRRQKTRIGSKKNSPLYEAFLDVELLGEPGPEDEIVRTKTIIPEKLSLDEAIARMDLLGHSFFIYTDDETGKIAVVYQRNDGGYGLIETE